MNGLIAISPPLAALIALTIVAALAIGVAVYLFRSARWKQ